MPANTIHIEFTHRMVRAIAIIDADVRNYGGVTIVTLKVLADFTNLIQVGEVASQLKKKGISIDIAVLNASEPPKQRTLQPWP